MGDAESHLVGNVAHVTPQEFGEQAAVWLAENRGTAPRDYGAILPPDLADDGRKWQATLSDAGYAGISWPTEFGGRGLTPEHAAAWITQCALAQVPPFLNMVGCVLAGGALLAFGSPEQQAAHLRPIITGERIWCQLFSEPEAGSDLASLRTSAVRDGDDYVVSGQKVWCSNGRVADWGILMARTDPDARHKGISFFLLDMASEGAGLRPLRQMNGEAEFDEVFLDEVRVPATNLLGPENEGWMVGMSALTNERGYIGASGISLRRRLDAMLECDTTTGLLSAPGARIAGGTSEIQRNIISERLLGMPKEPRTK